MTRRKKAYRTTLRRILPQFDPEPSAAAGALLLKKAKVRFALVGRVAVWLYLPPEKQAFTKDVDFAVPFSARAEVIALAGKSGYRVRPLDIGGCAVRAKGIAVDFIDRHPALDSLFAAAIKAAQRNPLRVKMGNLSVPIVPKNYLIAMKIATMEEKDEHDAEWLIHSVPDNGYSALHALVTKYLGRVLALRLDVLARKVGHPGPGRKEVLNRDASKGPPMGDAERKRGWLARWWKRILAGTLAIAVILWALDAFVAWPIEGYWWGPWYKTGQGENDCRNYLKFAGGTAYLGKLPSQEGGVFFYRKQPDGTYSCIMQPDWRFPPLKVRVGLFRITLTNAQAKVTVHAWRVPECWLWLVSRLSGPRSKS